ncbi:MAG: WYL domain-containing transcriptional regulator [Nitrospira sp.]
MPRNDQVTRQWHLLQRLGAARNGLTLAELVEAIPAELTRHPRTVRRDLAALESSHFPLLTERVDGEVRWRLLDGFKHIPALRLSPTELMALAFSRRLLSPLQGTLIQTSLNSALSKISAAIPSGATDYLQRLDQWFSVGLGPHKNYRHHRETIDILSQAIANRHTVQMRYFSAGRNATTRREVDPYRLRYVDGGLYLIAYCHWRKDVRMFAVERIKSLTPTDHPYQLPLHFDLEAYVEDALVVMRGERITVELQFDKATAAWVKDRTWHSSQQFTPVRGGQLRMTLQVADTRELLGWVLSFGGGVQVLKPERLQQAVKDEAKKLLACF